LCADVGEIEVGEFMLGRGAIGGFGFGRPPGLGRGGRSMVLTRRGRARRKKGRSGECESACTPEACQ
jgi:hypothetical protein